IKRNTYDKELQHYIKYSAKRLLNDDRFSIDYEYFYKTLETRLVYDYEIVGLKISDIKRVWNGEKLPITECHAYKYLMGDKEQYYDYCEVNKIRHTFDMSEERFNNLIQSIEKNGYNNENIVIVDENNILKDGQHRLSVLCKMFGEDHEINVLKIYYRAPKK
ncbi:MAG: hypothetical protein J6V40_02290, partial [Clostridia bacterium]|nr:hypothetical protein [Clostridia bacterium]